MTISEMIVKLEESGCYVQRVPNNPNMIHVDGYHPPKSRGLPDWIWNCPKWGVSSCGIARVFMFRVG